MIISKCAVRVSVCTGMECVTAKQSPKKGGRGREIGRWKHMVGTYLQCLSLTAFLYTIMDSNLCLSIFLSLFHFLSLSPSLCLSLSLSPLLVSPNSNCLFQLLIYLNLVAAAVVCVIMMTSFLAKHASAIITLLPNMLLNQKLV